jgi:hypothetical protein
LTPTSDGTQVTLTSDNKDIVDVANADGNIAQLVTSYTRPEKAEQLSLYGS